MGKLSAVIIEQMKKKQGGAAPAPAKSPAPKAAESDEEEAPEGADEEAAMGEFMDALDRGDRAEALSTFRSLLSACYPKE